MRLIDADKLKEEIGECPENWLDSPEEMQAVDDWNGFMNVIDAQPTIEAEPVRHGHWKIFKTNDYRVWKCNLCGFKCYGFTYRGWNFCTNCGARMDEVSE